MRVLSHTFTPYPGWKFVSCPDGSLEHVPMNLYTEDEDKLRTQFMDTQGDGRYKALAATHLELAFMYIRRAQDHSRMTRPPTPQTTGAAQHDNRPGAVNKA